MTKRKKKKFTSTEMYALAAILLAGTVMLGVQQFSAKKAFDVTEPVATVEAWNKDVANPNAPTTTSPSSGDVAPSGSTGKVEQDGGRVDEGEGRHAGHQKLLEMPATRRGENVVSHTGYVLSYNSETNCPNWVAWELTRQEASSQGPRSDEFAPDPALDTRHQVTTSDYKGSGYDRGHMCPAGDMKWSPTAQRECFFMSNMCPQLHALNAGGWEKLESACRRWAKQEGSVYIACGPVFGNARKVRTIGRDHTVRVPDGFFKVVLSLRQGEEKAIGFYYANNDRDQTMESAAMTVDEVERMTGYDFFYQVDKKIEKRVEAQYNLRDWK